MTGQRTFFDSFESGMVTVSESGQEVFLIVFRLDFDSSDQTPLRAGKILRFQAPKGQEILQKTRAARATARETDRKRQNLGSRLLPCKK